MKFTVAQFEAERDGRLAHFRRREWPPERLAEIEAAYAAKRLDMEAAGILAADAPAPAPLPPPPPAPVRRPWWKRILRLA